MSNIKELIESSTPLRRWVEIYLDQDGLVSELEDLERQLAALDGVPDTSSLSGGPRTDLTRKIQAVRTRAAARVVRFVFEGMPRGALSDLLLEHPPRPDVPADVAAGFNEDTFFQALIKATLVAPVLDEEDWSALLGTEDDEESEDAPPRRPLLTDPQFDKLGITAWLASRRDVDVPFLLTGSRLPQTSDPD